MSKIIYLLPVIFFMATDLAWSEGDGKADTDEKEKITLDAYFHKIVSNPALLQKRDPFVKAAPPFEVPVVKDETAIDATAPVLERYPSSKYSVVATLLGDQYPRALLRLPTEEKGRVLIVKENDKLGNRGGIISKISKEAVVVSEKKKSPVGKMVTEEIQLRVSAPAK